MTNPCQFFKVQLDPNGFPIVSTMMGFNNATISNPCNQAIVPPTQMSCPAGTVQCFDPNGLRYFYKVNNQTGYILDNSMFSRYGKPEVMCSGIYTILEFLTCS